MQMKSREYSLFSRLLDLIAPRTCRCCGCRLAFTETFLCASCDIQLPRTGFADRPDDNAMAKLFYGRVPLERAASMAFYRSHDNYSKMVYRLKYGRQPEIGREMGRFMAEEMTAKGFFDGITALVPVPLAPKRQRQRGYNQSYEMALGIAQVTRLPILKGVLQRTKFERSQTVLTHQERADNVKDVFKVKNASLLSGQHVLLVDDIVTTGATMTACATKLKQAADVQISCISWGFAH